MSVKVTGLVWESYPEGGNKLLVMLRLADWANDDGELHGTRAVDTIARSCKIDRRTVQRIINKLCADGWLKKTASNFSANQFQISVGKLSQQPLIDEKPHPKGAAKCQGRQNATGGTGATLNVNIYIPPIVPQEIPRETLLEYLAYRKTEKKDALSEYGCNRLIKRLQRLHAEGEDVKACLTEAMDNGWRGVFAINSTPGGSHGAHQTKGRSRSRSAPRQSAADRVRAANNRPPPGAG